MTGSDPHSGGSSPRIGKPGGVVLFSAAQPLLLSVRRRSGGTADVWVRSHRRRFVGRGNDHRMGSEAWLTSARSQSLPVS
jgi:hypothetical protein